VIRTRYFNARDQIFGRLITDINTPGGDLISLDEQPLLELNEILNGLSTATTP